VPTGRLRAGSAQLRTFTTSASPRSSCARRPACWR
jgi:hypothetical protein